MLPLGGLLIVLFSGWRLKSDTALEWLGIETKEWKLRAKVLILLVKVVAPLGVAAVLVNSSGLDRIGLKVFSLIF